MKWVMFNKTPKMIELGKYKCKVQEQEKKWNKCQENKKLLMATIYLQLCDYNLHKRGFKLRGSTSCLLVYYIST